MTKHSNIRKELIRLTIDCNARCGFCNFSKENEQAFENPTVDLVFEQIDQVVAAGITDLVFSGGEPLVYKNIFKVIKYAKDNGVENIELQTNLLLADERIIKRLKESGVTSFFVSLHTANNFINNKLFNLKYDFKKVVNNLILLNKYGLMVVLNPVVNNLTYKTLPSFATFIVKNLPWIESVSLSVIQPHGKALKNKNLLPDYSKIEPYIEKFKQIIKENKIRIINPYCGLPMCLADWQKKYEENVEYVENLYQPQSDKNKIRLKICSDCTLNKYCNGVWREYVSIFGEDVVTNWLHPVKNH